MTLSPLEKKIELVFLKEDGTSIITKYKFNLKNLYKFISKKL